MSAAAAPPVLPLDRIRAVAFDLDGVITDTARLHEEAWTRVFNDLFARQAPRAGAGLAPFTSEDYRRHIDGRPRYQAIRDFLALRGLALAEGDASDAADRDTVQGIGARKNRLFLELVRTKGVDVYPATVALIRRLRGLGVRIAVVSASRNCAEILRIARLAALVDVRVDGRDAEELGLAGKPAPDTFLEAARRLGLAPAAVAVVEDATAGVAAARAGGFGLVIGVDRNAHAAALSAAGADIVVTDLAQLELPPGEACGAGAPDRRAKPDVHRLDPFITQVRTETCFLAEAAPEDPWLFVYDGFDPLQQGQRETLLAVGNGYFVTRGAAAEAHADGVHYPGTYLAGGYNRLTTVIGNRAVEHEDLVNLPNWLPLTFRLGEGDWFDLRGVEILSCRQALDLRRGLHLRSVRFRDAKGRTTQLQEERFVHMGHKHLAGQKVTITAVDWSGPMTVRAMLDGGVVNTGVPRYRSFNGKHLRIVETALLGEDAMLLRAEAVQSRLGIALAARLHLALEAGAGERVRRPFVEPERLGQDFVIDMVPGGRAGLEKIVALYTSRDRAIADPRTAASLAVARAEDFDRLVETHALAWEHLWRRCDLSLVESDGEQQADTQRAVRLHILHLLQTASRHTMELDAGIPARGWHGEAYRGHIFWDELFIFPFLNLRLPVLARALLLYRYRRLDEARFAARRAGFRGAMFPWQSGSDGREETDVMYFNPYSGNWIEDNTHLQRHVGAAVAYNVWRYYQATGDAEFLYSYGAELMVEIARFFASLAEWNGERQRYDIRGVMGPDEFHDRYPGRDRPGLDNNAYTNVMAAWCIARALDLFELLPDERCQELCELLALGREEIARFEEVSRKLYLPFLDGGILSQFEGYDALAEFDWEGYRRRYDNIMRLDLILEAEGDTPNRYKLSKQADVLMLFYLFSADELAEMVGRLGYAFDPDSIPRTIDYYLRRTSHGSTLSAVAHAWVLARGNRPRAWSLFSEALRSDIADIQGGTTREGIHLGAMAGTVDLLQRCFTGLELRGEELCFAPVLPQELGRLCFRLRYRRHSLRVEASPQELRVESDPSDAAPITIVVAGRAQALAPGGRLRVPLQGDGG